MDLADLRIYAADVGSVKRSRFAWACSHRTGGQDIRALVAAVADDLAQQHAVALGLECPLWVPIAMEPDDLTMARTGEGNRPWSAGAGCGALATGLVEAVWILAELKATGVSAELHLDWSTFRNSTGPRLLLWEAFVSAAAKGQLHVDDARIAVEAFTAALPDPSARQWCTPTQRVFSMIGAAALRTGWSEDLSLLGTACLVLGDRAAPAGLRRS